MSDRQRALDNTKLRCRLTNYRADDSSDPYDPSAWEITPSLRCVDWQYDVVLRPPTSFILDITHTCEGRPGHDVYGWNGHELYALAEPETPRATGTITSDIHSFELRGEHFLVPMEMQFFERHQNLVEAARDFRMTFVGIEEVDSVSCVHLSGSKRTEDTSEQGAYWLDPKRQYLPIRLEYFVNRPSGERMYEFHYRVKNVIEFRGIHIAQEAVFYLYNPKILNLFNIRHWMLDDITDHPVSDNEFAITFPTGTMVFDLIRKKRWEVGLGGKRSNEEAMAPDAQAALDRTVHASIIAENERRARQRILPWIVAASVIATLGFGTWRYWWNRRAGHS